MPASIYCAQAYFGQRYPPVIHWGVDSLTPANFGPVTDPVTGQTYQYFYDAVVSSVGASRRPEFWGRYIGESGNLTQAEVDFLHCRNCRVLLIYRDTASKTPTPPLVTYQNGVDHATKAIRYIENPPPPATPLNVPRTRKVWIYADIEYGNGFPNPMPEFLRGWSDYMAGPASSYGGAGGVYGNTGQPGFTTPYCDAYNNDPRGNFSMRAGGLLWTNQVTLCAGPACDTGGYASNPPRFTPTIPLCSPLVPPVVIYQYAIDLTVAHRPTPVPSPYGDYNFAVDFDLADDKGFESMWAPGPWEACRVDLHNDVNNQGIVSAPSLERLPDGRLVAILVIAHVPNDVARVGAYVSTDGGGTWAAPVELPETGRVPQTMVERGGHIYCFALGSTIRTIVQAKFDTTALAWVNFGTQQSPIYWRLWYTAPGTGSEVIRFPRAARDFGRTQAGLCILHSSVGQSKFVPIAANGDAGTAETIPTGGSSGPVMLRWPVGSDAVAARMRPIDQLQYVNGQLFFDPGQPQFVDIWKRSSGTWSLDRTYTVDTLEKLTTPIEQSVMWTLRRGLYSVDYAWGQGTQDGGDIHGLFSDDPLRADAGGLGGFLTARWRRQVAGVWSQDTIEFKTDAAPPLDEEGYNLHSQPIWLEDKTFRAIVQMAGPTYPGDGHYWFVRRRLG